MDKKRLAIAGVTIISLVGVCTVGYGYVDKALARENVKRTSEIKLLSAMPTVAPQINLEAPEQYQESSSTEIKSDMKQMNWSSLIEATPSPKELEEAKEPAKSVEESYSELGITVVGSATKQVGSGTVTVVGNTQIGNSTVAPESVVVPEATSPIPIPTAHPEIMETTYVDDYDPNSFNIGVFDATAYDLSIESCGKAPDHPQYGDTASGFSLIGFSREEAMSVAVDDSIIPLGTKLYIKFTGEYESFTGVYTARDTGSAIKGRKIDIFMGDFNSTVASQVTKNFGHQAIEVSIVK